MRRLICAFVVRIWPNTHFLMTRLTCFLRLQLLAQIGYIPQCKGKNPRGLYEISFPLVRMLLVFVCAHFDPFRSENKSIEWTVVTDRMDSENSVDISYMDMSEFSNLYSCQVYKYWNVELQNVNISKYPWPLDGIIICITLVTLLFLYVFCRLCICFFFNLATCI